MAEALTVPPIAVATWDGRGVSIAEIEAELARMRVELMGVGDQPPQRTSVLTHVAWVPPEWLDAAKRVLEGMEDRHPSRTVILVPKRDDPPGIHAVCSVRCFSVGERAVCGEVVELHLCGRRSGAPASLVLPLAITDLPVFLRWRGEPPFGAPEWEQLVEVADRVVVDSSEWGEPRYAELAAVFDRTAVSDLAWARILDWRVRLAGCWPGIAEQEIHVSGPPAEGGLLRAWLVARLRRALRPLEPAAEVRVRLDGEELRPPEEPPLSPSDLLSAELDRFGRDPIYEEAALAAAGAAASGAGV